MIGGLKCPSTKPPALLTRYIIQSLPIILFTCVGLALVSLKVLQFVQQRVLHVLPFGALSQFNVVDSCVGILVAGLFMLYFGTCFAASAASTASR